MTAPTLDRYAHPSRGGLFYVQKQGFAQGVHWLQKKERVIPLHEQAIAALRTYSETRSTLNPKVTTWGYFFPGQNGWKLNHSTVNRLFKRHSKTINPQNAPATQQTVPQSSYRYFAQTRVGGET